MHMHLIETLTSELYLNSILSSFQLQISPGVKMTFINNSAQESGGGIYVEFPPVRFVVDIFNRLCFLQYSDGTGRDVPPQEWEVGGGRG